MSQNSVLILTYGFPPHIKSLGGAIRVLKLAEYLQNEGCDVHVVCARTGHFNTFGYDKLLTSLNITYVDDPIATLGSRMFAVGDGQTNESSRKKTGPKSFLKRIVIGALTPDTAVLANGRLRRVAQKLVAAQPDMTVITSGPPHSIHLVGRWLKRRFSDIRWFVDYRDSWNGTPLFRKTQPILQTMNEHFERSVLSRCDEFTYISSPMVRKAKEWGGPDLSAKSHLIANGFDIDIFDMFEPKEPQAGPLRLGYFGAIDDGANSYRNPTSIFKIIGKYPIEKIRIELYGSINISSIWQATLGDRLFVGPQLSHRKAVQSMAKMDALLLLHTREDGADEVVTGKVFEYIATGIPIVAIGPKDTAVNDLLADDASAFVADHLSQEAISKLLAHLIACKANQTLPVRDASRISAYSRDKQFALFSNLINKHRE